MISMIELDSPIGVLRVLGTDDAVTGLYLPEQAAPPAPAHETPLLARAAAQLAEYFAGTRATFDVPLRAAGTAFQQRVWQALMQIPLGTTCSYGDIARMIDKPSASRAVGAANGKNPIAIIVPCHRVIGAGGTLTGYAGGLAAKRVLLAHEQRVAPLLP